MRRSIAAVLAGSVLAALPAVCGPVQAAAARVDPDQAGNVRVNADQAGATAALVVHTWKDIPFRWVVRQQYDFSCGSAALATLLLFHYGVKVNEQDVFQAMWKAGDQAKIRKVGFSLLDMKRALHDNGVQGDGYRLTLDQVERAKVPAIALITVGRYKHFVVIKGVQDGRVLTGDPAMGLKIYSRKDFEAIWNGVVFRIHDYRGGPPVFNRAGEWRPWAYAPVGGAVDRAPVSSLFIGLAPLNQITPDHPAEHLTEASLSARSRSLHVTAALAALILLAGRPARADDLPAPVADSELDGMRGGFMVDGIQFNFGALLSTTVNGQLALQTQVNYTPTGPQVTQTVGPNAVQGAPTNGTINGLIQSGIPRQDIALTNKGATAVIQMVTNGSVQNIVINTANNQNIQQATQLQLQIPALAQLQQLFAHNLALLSLMQNAQNSVSTPH